MAEDHSPSPSPFSSAPSSPHELLSHSSPGSSYPTSSTSSSGSSSSSSSNGDSSSSESSEPKACLVSSSSSTSSPSCVSASSLQSLPSPITPTGSPLPVGPSGSNANLTAAGELAFEQKSKTGELSPDDFEIVRCIGKGDVGTVYLARLKDSNPPAYFALKVLQKEEMILRKKVDRVLIEQKILNQLAHPFLVRLYGSFQTDELIYLVLEYCAGGAFFRILQRQPSHRISEDHARFYAAEVLLALEYLHSLGVVYRDLKPENVLLHSSGHIMLTDFDLSTMCDRSNRLRYSFVGTTDYLPPEIVKRTGHSFAVDWWTFGVFIFEMVFGKTPFTSATPEGTLQRIRQAKDIDIPQTPPVSKELRRLIRGLLNPNVEKRLGSRHGGAEVRMHPWFAKLDFAMLLEQVPPLVPKLRSPEDTKYFPKIEGKAVERGILSSSSSSAVVDLAQSKRSFRSFKTMSMTLPMRDGDLEHCELCGASLPLLDRYHACKLMRSSSSGYLLKQGHLRKSAWRKRWFQLDAESHQLRYWTSHDQESKARRTVVLTSDVSVSLLKPAEVNARHPVPHCFTIKSNGHHPLQIVLQAKTDVECKRWVSIIQSALSSSSSFSSSES